MQSNYLLTKDKTMPEKPKNIDQLEADNSEIKLLESRLVEKLDIDKETAQIIMQAFDDFKEKIRDSLKPDDNSRVVELWFQGIEQRIFMR